MLQLLRVALPQTGTVFRMRLFGFIGCNGAFTFTLGAHSGSEGPVSSNAPHSPQSFSELGLDARLVDAVEKLGFTSPTGIQAEAIPPLLEGRDIVARARTGSGKTAAFVVPILHLLGAHQDGPRAIHRRFS